MYFITANIGNCQKYIVILPYCNHQKSPPPLVMCLVWMPRDLKSAKQGIFACIKSHQNSNLNNRCSTYFCHLSSPTTWLYVGVYVK